MYIFHKMPVLSLVVLLVLVIEDGEAGNNTSNCKLDSVSKNSQAEKEALGRLEPLTNRNFTVNTGGDEAYTYQFRVCGDAGEIPEGGVVQRDKEGKETVVGRYNVTEAIGGKFPNPVLGEPMMVHIFAPSQLPAWEGLSECLTVQAEKHRDWVMLIYKNGSSYDRHCSSEGRKAIIMISCKPGVLAGDLAIILEERQREKNCFYLFELDSSAVCPPVSSKLSLGSILLIIGFTCLAVYLIGGFLYQRLVVGAKGMEQFPNYSFWQEIGNLTADGCDFVCRSRGSREEPPTCQGVATEPLGEESEERDDQLLPM